MSPGKQELAEWCRTFRLLFDSRPAQVALLDQSGKILETNTAWREFGHANGLSDQYECVGKNYLQECDRGAAENSAGAREACVGLLDVLHTRRPKFTLVYPCHSPTERRWFRMWVEPQLPDVPAVVVAHYRCLDKSGSVLSASAGFGDLQSTDDALRSLPGFSMVDAKNAAAKNNVLISNHCR